MKSAAVLDDLSSHIFWDVDEIYWPEHRAFVVQRVLECGTLRDFQWLKNQLGMNGIVETAKKLRSLDDKALHWIACMTHTPINGFRCYSTKRSLKSY